MSLKLVMFLVLSATAIASPVDTVELVPPAVVNPTAQALGHCLEEDKDPASLRDLFTKTRSCLPGEIAELARQARAETLPQLKALDGLSLAKGTYLQVYLEVFYRHFGELLKVKYPMPKSLDSGDPQDITMLFVDQTGHALMGMLDTPAYAPIAKRFEAMGLMNPHAMADILLQDALMRPTDLGLPEEQLVRLYLH